MDTVDRGIRSPKFVSLYQAQTYKYSLDIPINGGFTGFSCMGKSGCGFEPRRD